MAPRSTRHSARSGGAASGATITAGTLKHAFSSVGKSSTGGVMKSTKGAATTAVSEKLGGKKLGKVMLGVVVSPVSAKNETVEKIVLDGEVQKNGNDKEEDKEVVEVIKEATDVVKGVKSTKAIAGKKRKAEEELVAPEGRKEEKWEVEEPGTPKSRRKGKNAAVRPEIKKKKDKGEVAEEKAVDICPLTPTAEQKEKTEDDSAPKARKRTKIQEFMTSTPSIPVTRTTSTEEPVSVVAIESEQKASSKTKHKTKSTPKSTRKSKPLPVGQTTLNLNTIPKPNTDTESKALDAINTLLSKPPTNHAPPKQPAYLKHLVNIHSHLLTSIHLHLAQNGATSLPLFSLLKPHLERLSKRTISLPDIRKICWLTASSNTKGWLRPVDYGGGKIAIELSSEKNVGDINQLREEFEKKIEQFWISQGGKGKSRVSGSDGDDEVVFVPMMEVIVSETKAVIDTVLKGKGERRMKELKSKDGKVEILRGKGMTDPMMRLGLKKQQILPAPIPALKPASPASPAPASPSLAATEPTPPTPEKTQSTLPSTLSTKPTTATNGKLSLLDRIRAKHQATLLAAAAASSQPDSLTPAEAEAARARLSATQRLPEVIPILRSLRLRAPRNGAGRRSMSLEEVIQGIKQSVRNGITREEAELCIKLAGEQGVERKDNSKPASTGVDTTGAWKKGWDIQDEKGWVEVVECGGVKGVVFK